MAGLLDSSGNGSGDVCLMGSDMLFGIDSCAAPANKIHTVYNIDCHHFILQIVISAFSVRCVTSQNITTYKYAPLAYT